MKTTRGPLSTLALLILLATLTVATGCSDKPEPPPEVVSGTQVIIDPPGIYDGPGGRVRAVGILDRVDLEGGFWAVVGVAEGQGAESVVVAVIENPDSLDADLDTLRGRYVEVTGTLLDGASIRMSGPEIRASSIQVLGADGSDD